MLFGFVLVRCSRDTSKGHKSQDFFDSIAPDPPFDWRHTKWGIPKFSIAVVCVRQSPIYTLYYFSVLISREIKNEMKHKTTSSRNGAALGVNHH